MLKSMTGFGRGEYADEEYHFTVEIKTVNHRYNEIAIRMPKNLSPLEDKIRRTVSNTLTRGRIDIFISLEDYRPDKKYVKVDRNLATAYYKALEELAGLFGTPLNDAVSLIAKYPEVLKAEDPEDDLPQIWVKLLAALETAIKNLLIMRATEGEHIQRDLVDRLDKLVAYVDTIENRAPSILTEYREKLLNRLREVLANIGAQPDETRLLQEAALFADRINFTEEIVRLRSHLQQFKKTLFSEEAVGRKLDFIIQEINRETNTIASKGNDFLVANAVVEIKSEIEKIREQIQNIE